MFTGIIRERGRVVSIEPVAAGGVRLRLHAPQSARTLGVGDSLSVNGCCLTAIQVSNGHVALEAVPETLQRTSLGSLGEGADVNLELALRVGDPLGGHYVQGHVDGTGVVRSIDREGGEGGGVRVRIEAAPDILRYCAVKGSIAVDGVSLTIAELDDGALAVVLVPHTLAETTLASLQSGQHVNLEVDVLAKYVERLLGAQQA